jgi:opacity protein-like surface antigen
MRNIVALATLVLVLATAFDASAQWTSRRVQRTGGELTVGGGLNMCMNSGDASCDDMDSSFAILVSPGFRMSDIIGFYLDANYSRLGGDGIDSWAHLSLMPTARFFALLQGAELFFGAGVGYARIDSEVEGGGDYSWTNYLNMKLNVGGAFKVAPSMDIGVNLDYIFNADGAGEVCTSTGGEGKSCEDNEKGDLIDLLQIMAFAKFHF